MARNDLKALRLVRALSAVALGLAFGGAVFVVYVLTTHQLTVVHRISNIAALLSLIWTGGSVIGLYRDAARQVAAQHSAHARGA